MLRPAVNAFSRSSRHLQALKGSHTISKGWARSFNSSVPELSPKEQIMKLKVPRGSSTVGPAGVTAIVLTTFVGVLWASMPSDTFYPRIGDSGKAKHPLVSAANAAEDDGHFNNGHAEKSKIVPDVSVVQSPSPVSHAVSSSHTAHEEPVAEVVDDEKNDDTSHVAPLETPAPKEDPPISTPVVEEPAKSNMIKAQYVLVGGGTASYSAMKAIKGRVPEADVLIITAEDFPPYMRPPLSKELWFSDSPSSLKFNDWGGKEREIIYDPVASYHVEGSNASDGNSEHKPRLLMGHKVISMDADYQTLLLDDGRIVKYGKVLLATGGTPRHLDVMKSADSSKVSVYRSINDLKKLEEVIRSGKHVVIVGGGFLGSELACATSVFGRKYGTTVSQVYPEDGNMGLVFPKYLTKWTTEKISKVGVEVMPNKAITNAQSIGGKVTLNFDDGSSLEADHVVLAVGIEPNLEVAKEAGLEIDELRGGIMVNAELEARQNVFVAGDICSYHDITLGRRRVEHHDHAVLSGRWAGKNMLGAHKPYRHQSMFWSDLGPEIGYEAVGILDPSLPTVGLWAKASPQDTPKAASEGGEGIRNANIESVEESNETTPNEKSAFVTAESPNLALSSDDEYGKGIVFYLKGEKIVGVLMWNIFQRTAEAQRVVSEGRTADDIKELAALFKIHDL